MRRARLLARWEAGDDLDDNEVHELDHYRGNVDKRVCQGIGCPYGDH